MHHLKTFRPLLAALAGCVLIGCGGQGEGPGPGGPPGGRMGGGAPVAVNAMKITPRPYTDEFTALGTARANESIEITSRISNVVSKIHFEEGERVDADELLVELDNRDLRAQLLMAEAAFAQKRSQFRRSEQLGISRAVSEAELELLEADVLMAEAELRSARARLEDSFIRAPFAGTVGLRQISLGDLVGPDTVITTLDDAETIKLAFTIPETFLSSLNTGMPIEAASDVYPAQPFTGVVSNIDTRVDPDTRSVTVIAKLPNDDRLLRPGMFLTVAVQKRRDDVLMVPEEALVPRQGRQYVFVIEDGRAIEKQVELGVRAPGFAEIRDGLNAGEMVITEGTQKVRNGAAVRIVSNT